MKTFLKTGVYIYIYIYIYIYMKAHTCILPLLFKFEFCNEHAADVFKPKRLQFIWNLTDEWISSFIFHMSEISNSKSLKERL